MDKSFEIIEEGLISEVTKGSVPVAPPDNPTSPTATHLP